MKIFASVAAFAVMATMAFAYTFPWNTGSGAPGLITFDGNVLNSAELSSTITLYAVYLGADDVWSFDPETGLSTDQVINDTGTVTVNGFNTNRGRGNGTTEVAIGTEFDDGSVMTAGSSVFGVLITYVDADGTTWYNYSSNNYTVPVGVTDITGDGTVWNYSFSWDKSSEDAPSAGGGWWTIPEPMTVLCGLAGLALLLKRRA